MSRRLRIRDWSIALELDKAAAEYIHEETLKREMEREQRDREFWVNMFSTERSGDFEPEVVIEGPVGIAQLGQR